MIGLGAILSGAVMVWFGRDVRAASESVVADAIVHGSNLTFMAAMWCVVGVLFVVGAAHLHEAGTWRLIQLACIGISVSAVVRLVQMVRLDERSNYGLAAATVELVVPGTLMYLRQRDVSAGAT